MDKRLPEKTIFSSGKLRFEDREVKRLAVLIQLRGRQIGRRDLLNADSLVCGRNSESSDIAFGDDREISGRHCEFLWVPEQGKYIVRDLGSLNGTWVNGNKVDEKPLEDGDKIFIGTTVLKFTYHDVIEAEFHHEMDRLLTIDDLTGLVVKRNFDISFEDALGRAVASGENLSVLMMDMDGLKSINDTHGHFMGAYCIATVGGLLGECCAGKGLATRFGGDEFTIYLRDADKQTAVAWAEQLRVSILGYCFEKNDVRAHPTVSIGIATCPEDGKRADELVRKADEALYRAKVAGRNRVST